MGFDPARFSLPLAPPYPPGQSPYKVASVVYKSLLAFVEENVPGGLPAVLREIRDPALATFLSGHFSIASTADAVPLPYFGQAIARARGVPYTQQLHDANRWSARGRFFDVYRALVPIASVEALTVGLARAAKIIQPFGGLHIQGTKSKGVRGERTGVPHVLVAWMVTATSVFLESTLERLGSGTARATFGDPVEDGRTDRQVTYTLPFEIVWV
jgi:hypothetical protein